MTTSVLPGHDNHAHCSFAWWQRVLTAPDLGSHPEGRPGVYGGHGSPRVTTGWLVQGVWSPSTASPSLTHQHTPPGPCAGVARFGKTPDAPLNVNSLQPLDWQSWGPHPKPARSEAFACNVGSDLHQRTSPCVSETSIYLGILSSTWYSSHPEMASTRELKPSVERSVLDARTAGTSSGSPQGCHSSSAKWG